MIPECTTAEWYLGRERAPHLEQDGHRERLHATERHVTSAVTDLGGTSVVDLGCGDGGLLSLLQGRVRCWGYDLSPAAVQAAREVRGVDARLGDAVTGDIGWADVAVATEMLEHLVDPHGFAAKIREHARVLVASSPGLETDRSHYEFHTWAWDMDGYRAMIEAAGWSVAKHEWVAYAGTQVLTAMRP
jgi:2-polyprenyl-3-methyl-5-hydroxy-6-metoxy-1,4-benzoquinol methylase